MKTLRDRYRQELVRRFEELPLVVSARADDERDTVSSARFRRPGAYRFVISHRRSSLVVRRSHS